MTDIRTQPPKVLMSVSDQDINSLAKAKRKLYWIPTSTAVVLAGIAYYFRNTTAHSFIMNPLEDIDDPQVQKKVFLRGRFGKYFGISAIVMTFVGVTYASLKYYDSVRYQTYKKYQTLVDSYVLTKNFEQNKKMLNRKLQLLQQA